MSGTVTQGEDFILKIRVSDKVTKQPYDFTGFEGATAYFPSIDETPPVIVVGSNPGINILQFEVDSGTSIDLAAGEALDFEYRWRQNGKLYIEKITGQWNVNEQLF